MLADIKPAHLLVLQQKGGMRLLPIAKARGIRRNVFDEAGTLDFEPTCSLELLKKQLSAMSEYLYLLEVRAEVEKIEL